MDLQTLNKANNIQKQIEYLTDYLGMFLKNSVNEISKETKDSIDNSFKETIKNLEKQFSEL